MYTNELSHHGIKGMRWGVRRYQNEDGSLTDAGKRRLNPKKAIQKMSNEELEAINKRLTLESEYKNLRYEESKRGREAAEKALKAIGVVGITAIGIAGVTVGKEALKKFGSEFGSKMANTLHEQISSSMKAASEQGVKAATNAVKSNADRIGKAATNAVKSGADKIGKAATNAVKNVVSNPVSESKRNEILSKATDIGRTAAEKAIQSGRITRDQASEYANQIRQKAFEQLLKRATG